MKTFDRRAALGATAALCTSPALPATERSAPTALAVVDAYARAWERGDLPALLNAYHPEFTLHYFGRNALAGRHAGKGAALKVLAEVQRRTARALVAVRAVMAAGDQAVMLTRETMVAQGQPVSLERMYHYAVREGQLHACWVYDQDQRWMDELIGV